MTTDEFQLHVTEVLTRLDTNMASLVGNGQPGRVGKLESDVKNLEKARWTIGGIATGLSLIGAEVIHHFFHIK